MNIKKNIMKTMCAALVCTTIMSNLIPVYATETIVTETPMDESIGSGSDWTADEGRLEEIEVTYRQASSYNVTIPKTIALDTTKQAVYSVKVSGDIDANERVHVVPVDGISATENLDFYMKDQTPDSKKADVVAKVTQSKIYWNSEEVSNGYEETNNSVSAPDLTAGNWKGTFQVAINLETMGEHVHNFIDGKCDCGEIDPNHTHNYVDGTCTICGKETDPYETAPASEYNDWSYTLDDENNIITLIYYKGSKKDVIVYANYVVGGKTYKAQISNFSGSTSYMFSGDRQANCKNIKSIKFSNSIDTSNLTDTSYMFYHCESLVSIDWGNFDTSNVTNMGSMFCACSSLTDLDLSNFKTSNVTDMSNMFNGTALTSLDLSGFDTSNVTNMAAMFKFSKNLTSLDLSSFNTSNVTDMHYMFSQCYSLTDIDLNSFQTGNVTDMGGMFDQCSALTSLDLSSFETSNVTDMSDMFYKDTNLNNIYVEKDKWVIGSSCDVRYMFIGCGTSAVTYK